MYKTLRITDPSFDERRWQQFHDLHLELQKRFGIQFSFKSAVQPKELYFARLEGETEFHSFVALHDDRITAHFDLTIMRAKPSHPITFLRTDMIYEELPAGFAPAVAIKLTNIMKEASISSTGYMTYDRRNELLAEALCGNRLNRLDRYRLYRSRANAALIDEWLREYPKHFPNLKLIFFEVVPEEYVEQYVSLFGQFLQDMPSERKDDRPFAMDLAELRSGEAVRLKIGTHLYTYALLDASGKMIGHTNGAINERNPTEMHQTMSGVVSEYRGKGLSKWMKAALFRKVGEDFPVNEYLTTEMRAANKPIEAINRQIGYELYSKGGEYIISREALATVK
jgi:hypothetical protein